MSHQEDDLQHASRLLEEANEDPYGLVTRLLPTWAMPQLAVELAVGALRAAAREVRRRRLPVATFLDTLDRIARAAEFRPEVLKRFAPARVELSPVQWRTLRRQLPEVASRYTHLHRAGRLLIGRCPLHRDIRPSFTIYPNGTFFCFGCLRWGDAADLLAGVEGVSIGEALRRLRLPRE